VTLAYIITESKFDKEILEKLLPKHIVQDTEVVAASGKYGAQSLASTILAIKLLPVALVIDADTEDELRIREQADLLHQLLRQSSPGIPFEVFMAVPKLEVVFLENRSLIEKITERSFTDVEWQFAKSRPREFLEKMLGKYPTFIQKTFVSLNDEDVFVLQQYPLIKGLISFLSKTSPTPTSV
jgi:hypothetical protein